MDIVAGVVDIKCVSVLGNFIREGLEITDFQQALEVAGAKDLILQQSTALESSA